MIALWLCYDEHLDNTVSPRRTESVFVIKSHQCAVFPLVKGFATVKDFAYCIIFKREIGLRDGGSLDFRMKQIFAFFTLLAENKVSFLGIRNTNGSISERKESQLNYYMRKCHRCLLLFKI